MTRGAMELFPTLSFYLSLPPEPRLINGQTGEVDPHRSELTHGLIQILVLEVDHRPLAHGRIRGRTNDDRKEFHLIEVHGW